MFYKINYTGITVPGGMDPITKERRDAKHYFTIVGMDEETIALFASEQIDKNGSNFYKTDEKTGLPLFISHGFQHDGEMYVTRASKPNKKGVHSWYAISSEEEFDTLCKERPHMLVSEFGGNELRRLAVKRIRDRVRAVNTTGTTVVTENTAEDAL
jgi:hypothetical protein